MPKCSCGWIRCCRENDRLRLLYENKATHRPSGRCVVFMLSSECNRKTYIELPARQIVWYGILDVVDVGNPIIAADVGKVKQVENVDANPDTLEMPPEIVGAYPVFFSANQLILETDVKTFVGRCPEIADVPAHLWRCHGETVGNDAFQTEFQFRNLRKIVVEENAEAIALVRRARYFHAVQVFLGFHQ